VETTYTTTTIDTESLPWTNFWVDSKFMGADMMLTDLSIVDIHRSIIYANSPHDHFGRKHIFRRNHILGLA
jgi:hypothetical protein